MSADSSSIGSSVKNGVEEPRPAGGQIVAQDTSNERNAALDFTKGVLVLCMVVYHSLNYSSRPELGFQWMAFLPPSFIVITGFLISRVYFVRPAAADHRTRIRLVTRGAKLLLIFTVLNLMASIVRQLGHQGEPLGVGVFLGHWFDIYVVGNGRWAAFEVLLPISYLLLLGPLWLWIARQNESVLTIVSVATVGACAFLEFQGWLAPNLALISAGLVGLGLGRLATRSLDCLGRYWLICLFGYCLYTATTVLTGQSYLIQVLGACIALGAFYALGSRVGSKGWLQKRISLLGGYSLLSYIGQIAILQILGRFVGRPNLASVQFLLLFLTTLVLMALSVELIHWARRNLGVANTTYKLVFA